MEMLKAKSLLFYRESSTITKTHAISMKCGQPANYSQRIFESEERVAVGAAGM